jgi:hypothetical protein
VRTCLPITVNTNFHLLGPLKEAPEGRRFRCHEDINNAAHQWLRAQPKTLYYDGIKQLAGRWEKCVEKQGDYVEK